MRYIGSKAKDMQELQTWRALLGTIIQDIHERQRIANELGVSPVTLTRWVNNQARPRQQHLHQLLRVLPEHRSVLRELLAEEFTEFAMKVTDGLVEDTSASREIPSEFYTRVVKAYCTTPRLQRFWSISNLILQQALGQLDPNQLGTAITVAQCMPPSGTYKVRSVRERTGRGTYPWNTNLDQKAIFLGIESLAGYAISSCRSLSIQNKHERFFPVRWVEWEESATVCPIMREDCIAGCLLVSSTQPDYFLTFRQTLIQNYADLMVLAFEPDEFYERRNIELRIMPPHHIQESHFRSLRKRISALMSESVRNQHPINIVEAEQRVWQQLEEELLQVSPETEE